MVLHDDTAHAQALGIAAFCSNLRDLHVHFVVFDDIHGFFC